MTTTSMAHRRGRQIHSRTLAYLVHLVDSGQTANGRLGLYVGRRMRCDLPVVRPCPPLCKFCLDDRMGGRRVG